MLHAKFQDHRTLASGVEVLKAFNVYWRGGHISYVT